MKLVLETEDEAMLAGVGSTPPDDLLAYQASSVSDRLFHRASIYVAAMVIGKAFTVVVQVVLGRWLGADRYGLYALGYSVITLVSWIAVLGLDQGVLRYCAVYRTQDRGDKVRATLWRSMMLASMASVLTAGLLALGSSWIARTFFTPSFALVLLGFALALPFLTLIRIAGTYLQSINDIYRMCVMQLLARPIANLGLLGVVILLGWRLNAAVGAFVLCCVLTACLGAYYLRENFPQKRSNEHRVLTNHSPLMRYSVALMFVGLCYQMILRAPQVLLGHLANNAEVGVYSAGASFALAFGFMTLTFLQPAMPMMVELYETKQMDGLRKLYQSATRWTLALTMPAFLGLCLFSNQIIWLFGREYAGAGAVLVLLSLGWLVYYGKGPGSALLEMTGRQNLDLANTAMVGVLVVAMSYLAIPHYGAMGAAIATSGSIVVWALAEYIEVLVLYGLSPWSKGSLVNIFGAVATTFVNLWLRASYSWQIVLVITICVYGAFYVISVGLEPNDRRALSALLMRVRGRLV